MDKVAVDIVIIGGGIAGLWTLQRLRQAGYSAILLESAKLGGGQTVKSQGIIHGGMKYALQGVLTNEALSMTALPRIWRDCLAGKGAIDLSKVKVLSQNQYLFAPNKLIGGIAGLAATKTLSSHVEALKKEAYPSIFQNEHFKGQVFALDEIVLDVPSLIKELVKANQEVLFKIEPMNEQEIKLDEKGNMLSANVYLGGQALEITAQQFIFTAGSGNEVMIKKLNKPDLAMQTRPLHMTMVKVPFAYALYAHCLALGVRPRMTITSHYLQDGSLVWYLGGALAEEGVKRSESEQNQAALKELTQIFPWLDFKEAVFSSFMVDRAEPYVASGLKPEAQCLRRFGNIAIAWPTKLAFAPTLADDILQQFKIDGLTHLYNDMSALRAWPMPPIASAVWEASFCKNV